MSISRLIIILISIGTLCAGCASSESLYRYKSFEYSNHAFDAVEQGPEFMEKIHIPAFDLYIVSDCGKFDWDKATDKKNGIIGYYDFSNGRVWILGKLREDTYYFNQ